MAESTKGGFTFPEFYSYPPYFTIQPVKATREKQLACWREMLLAWCRHDRVFEIDVATCPVFENKSINRSLNLEARQVIIGDLLSQGYATADPSAEGKSAATKAAGVKSVYVLWRSMSEWESTLLDWAHRTAQDVLTIDELCNPEQGGEVGADELFCGMPKNLMRAVLRRLEKQGKVTIFQGGAQDDEGVKFS
mmetsp:Transcript_9503/g.24412  ORF Transcript_9503/g.24412 Transcript_9503/m.24412 type:complete len:193 (+) Transcript_9503:209-787(+)